jgi:hypothetical protein
VKNVLAAVLVVSVASIALSQSDKPQRLPASEYGSFSESLAQAPATKPPAAEQNARPQRKPEDYQKCEYKVLDLGKGSTEALEKSLNDAAKEGFELERVVGDRIGIMRRNFMSERPTYPRQQSPGSTIPQSGPTS